MIMDEQLASSLTWFTTHGGSINPLVTFTEFPPSEGGRGAVSQSDIPENTTLFTIPRDLTLSTRTSCLPGKFGREAWEKAELDQGWTGLIMCMLWEASRESHNNNEMNWMPYIDSLPDRFDTPMFWTENELEELMGTSVLDKVGKLDAEKDYREKLVPAIKSRLDLFPEILHSTRYSVEAYHIMGSRILSRSFHVEGWEEEEDGKPHEHDHPNDVDEEQDVSMESTQNDNDMQVDQPVENQVASAKGDSEGSIVDTEEEENSSDIAMVPMADLLNARCNAGNAKLFYEEKDLKMISTRAIKAGEQIWNTYGDPPNSDLLRRYGHVDELPLPEELGGGIGTPKDVVELRADVVVEEMVFSRQSNEDDLNERIEFWLEEGGDDVFVLDHDTATKPPPELIAIVRLLAHPRDEWIKDFRDKGRLPKPKLTRDVCVVLKGILGRKMQEYPNTFEDDTKLLQSDLLVGRKRKATIVRVGEMRILQRCLTCIEGALEVDDVPMKNKESKSVHGKRVRDDQQGGGQGKKAKR